MVFLTKQANKQRKEKAIVYFHSWEGTFPKPLEIKNAESRIKFS